jgi:ricin-type beta-trefoil lectin protein
MIGSRVRKMILAGLLALGVGAAGLVATTPAQASPPPNQGWGEVYNGASPRCLDSGVPANAQLWNCSGSIYQYWVFTGLGRIKGNSPSGCLDDGAGLVGSGAFLTSCNGSSHQIWGYDGVSLVNMASGLCLDADLGTIGQQGTRVQVWTCTGGANQAWYFQYE